MEFPVRAGRSHGRRSAWSTTGRGASGYRGGDRSGHDFRRLDVVSGRLRRVGHGGGGALAVAAAELLNLGLLALCLEIQHVPRRCRRSATRWCVPAGDSKLGLVRPAFTTA